MGFTAGTFGKNDTTGWAQFTPTSPWAQGTSATPAGTRIICVSSSTGSDTTGTGTMAAPYKTVLNCLNIMDSRAGKPDWLLLKRGDTFTDDVLCDGSQNNIWAKGQDANNFMLISNYDPSFLDANVNPIPDPVGSPLARPVISYGASAPLLAALSLNHSSFTTQSDYLAIVGIEFYQYNGDPSNAAYNDALAVGGIYMNNGSAYLLIENCKLRHCDISLEGFKANSIIRVRRNVITNVNSTGKAQGLYLGDIAGTGTDKVAEENVLNHNGWDNTTENPSSNLNHNYYGGQGGNQQTIRGNIFIDDPSGIQFRPGGTFYDNCVISGQYGSFTWSPDSTVGVSASETSYNVFTETGRLSAYGTSFSDGLIMQKSYLQGPVYAGYFGNNIHDNIICNLRYAFSGGVFEAYNSCNGVNVYNNVMHNVSTSPSHSGFANGSILEGSVSITSGGTTAAADGYYGAPITGGTPSNQAGAYFHVVGGTVISVTFQMSPFIFGSGDGDLVGGAGYTTGDVLSANWALATPSAITVTGFSFKPTKVSSGNIYDASNEYELSGYPDSTRSIASYATLHGYGTTVDSFAAAAIGRSKQNWDPNLTAIRVNNYFRAGFGKTLLTYDGSATPVTHGGRHLGKF